MENENNKPEVEEKPPVNEPVSRETRRAYVFFVTFFCLMCLAGMIVFGVTGALAITIAEGLINIIELLVMMYVGASVLDRSELLSHIGTVLSKNKRGG